MSYLVKNLAEFFIVLRTAGLNVSVSECLAAVEALEHIDISDRSQVKAALSACLAKNTQGRDIFSRAFDLYFIPREARSEYIGKRTQIIEKRKQEIEEAAQSLKFQDSPIELSDDFKEIFAALPAEERKGLEDFLDTTSAGKNVRAGFKGLAESMVRGKLSSLKQKYRVELKETMGMLSRDTSEAGIIAGEVSEEVLKASGLLQKNIGEINNEDVPAAIKLIAVLVEKLRRELSRRYKRTGKRAGLDLKKTIRNNLSTGQVMFKLSYRSRSRSKNKLLLFCDVSASMFRFSGFVLQFMIGMGKGFASLESYIFSDDAEKINTKSFYGLQDFEARVKAGGIWGKGTDIGTSLGKLLDNRAATVSSSTVFVIVSDAKTLDYRHAAARLKELSARVKRVLWLNPVPSKDWTGIKGLDELAKYCTMLDCSTLERLAAACGSL